MPILIREGVFRTIGYASGFLFPKGLNQGVRIVGLAASRGRIAGLFGDGRRDWRPLYRETQD